MATLTEQQRADLMAQVMRDYPRALGGMPLDKADLREVIDSLDDHNHSGTASLNSAIPPSQRALLSDAQKSWLQAQVVAARQAQGV